MRATLAFNGLILITKINKQSKYLHKQLRVFHSPRLNKQEGLIH